MTSWNAPDPTSCRGPAGSLPPYRRPPDCLAPGPGHDPVVHSDLVLDLHGPRPRRDRLHPELGVAQHGLARGRQPVGGDLDAHGQRQAPRHPVQFQVARDLQVIDSRGRLLPRHGPRLEGDRREPCHVQDLGSDHLGLDCRHVLGRLALARHLQIRRIEGERDGRARQVGRVRDDRSPHAGSDDFVLVPREPEHPALPHVDADRASFGQDRVALLGGRGGHGESRAGGRGGQHEEERARPTHAASLAQGPRRRLLLE